MDLYEKISILGPNARYDTCGPKDFGQTTDIPGVYHAKVGGSRICRLFKVLQTNVCLNNCRYCAFRRDRSCRRVVASPEEMARAFDSAYSRCLVDGLFLSSGIVENPQTTMTRMLETVEIVRKKYRYPGYVHLKIMPGSPPDTIRAAVKLANRVSLNIESPTESSLGDLAPDKELKKGFYYTLSLIKEELKRLRYAGRRTPSLTTQFVVGAGEEKDQEIILATHSLYKNFGLKRVFYSGFRPVLDTPLADKPAVSLTRGHRLYQADFLLRFYRFSPWEIPLGGDGFLSEVKDPKTLWAENHPGLFPVNLNRAGYWQLLRVPGIGPVSAKKIIGIRRQSRVRSLDQLKGLRFQINKLASFAYC